MFSRNILRQAPLKAGRSFSIFNPSIRYARKLSSSRTQGHLSRTANKYSNLAIALALGGCGIVALANLGKLHNDANVWDDGEATVNVDSAVTPFPVRLGPPKLPLSTEFSMLGYGFRSVTFISFKVYALGIYIADQDRHLVADVLDSKFLTTAFIDTDASRSHKENVKQALDDPEKSTLLIGNLLDSGVRMAAKLTPIRNTDFNHLRDGFIRTILNHPEAKNNQEVLSAGLDELKQAFSEKGRIAKDDDLVVELQANGGLQFFYFNRKKDQVTTMGRVQEPLVGKLLFSQYMSGPKPLSPSAKESVASHLAAMV
ncbi:hypothetical protein HG536_0C06320 [Torulaspora globosa]|uniref:Altered inheritance of mitochondria protein 18, mitochondrial n=1 Tax=Torulaspora globosa TaxID=48254 RepID=A0A7G3ZG27_9SACH|nr:uncharacterized protein HG536_0C06320 [Torulaspora globosa]QLL32463.1 hypothetical protein HG536_0C06320 [Torulaspora globosa]